MKRLSKVKKTLEELLEEALVPEDEHPYEVPDNWLWSKANIVCDVRDGTHDSPLYINDGIPLITSKNLNNGILDFNNVNFISIEDHNNISKRSKVDNGDILFAMIGTIGNPVLVENIEYEFSIKNVALFKPRKKLVLSSYIYYYLNNKFYLDTLSNQSKGSTQKFISLGKLRGSLIPLPPQQEQKRIVEKIKSMFIKLDEAKELIEEAREGFKKRKASILAKAFRGELTNKWREGHPDVESADELLNMIQSNENISNEEIDSPFDLSDKWELVILGTISELITKGASPRWQGINYTNDPSQVLFITSENVREGYLDLNEPKYLENFFNNKQKRSILKKGDILLNIVGASIGRAAIYDKDYDANINQAVSLIRLNELIDGNYIKYFLNSTYALLFYNQNKVDVARANLSLKDVSSIPIPLPSNEEQKEIVSILDKLLKEESKIKELTQFEEQIESLKKSILNKAFRGQLGTNDPENEKAIDLLKEVMEEKLVDN